MRDMLKRFRLWATGSPWLAAGLWFLTLCQLGAYTPKTSGVAHATNVTSTWRNNAVIRTYGWVGDRLVLLRQGQSAYTVVTDRNGNVTALVNQMNGVIAARYEYGPFGMLLKQWGPMALENPMRFSSEYQDDITGLIYYGHRYFNPATQRWLSRDPIGFAGGPNLYCFVANDPINQRDELGLFFRQYAERFANWVYEKMMAHPGERTDGFNPNTSLYQRSEELGIGDEGQVVREFAKEALGTGVDLGTDYLALDGAGRVVGAACKIELPTMRFFLKAPPDVAACEVRALGGKNTPKLFEIVRYSREAAGFEKHHGVLDAWARANIPGYTGGTAPTILLTPARHNATRAVFNKWRAEQGWARQAIDWTRVSPQQAQSLTHRMLEAAGVPKDVVSSYLRAFYQHIYGL